MHAATGQDPVCDCAGSGGVCCVVPVRFWLQPVCGKAVSRRPEVQVLVHTFHTRYTIHSLRHAFLKSLLHFFKTFRTCRRDWTLEGSTRQGPQGVPRVSLGAVGCSWGLHSAPTLNLGWWYKNSFQHFFCSKTSTKMGKKSKKMTCQKIDQKMIKNPSH